MHSSNIQKTLLIILYFIITVERYILNVVVLIERATDLDRTKRKTIRCQRVNSFIFFSHFSLKCLQDGFFKYFITHLLVCQFAFEVGVKKTKPWVCFSDYWSTTKKIDDYRALLDSYTLGNKYQKLQCLLKTICIYVVFAKKTRKTPLCVFVMFSNLLK